MEKFLVLFEEAAQTQAEVDSHEKACEQARSAGLGVFPTDSIVSCTGNPRVVLLKLIKSFILDGNLVALVACEPLIIKLTKLQVEPKPVNA